MGSKLPKGQYPSGHSLDDFQCFGPPATKDGEFDNAKIADLGCFTQDGKDSNKYYHAAVVKSKQNGKWYTYFEWGRTGANKADQQFIECIDELDAQAEFVKQLRSKNDKRGQWVTVAGQKVLQAKPGKDCYLVRPMATRTVGLPDGRNITLNQGAKPSKPVKKKASSSTSKADDKTLSLMRDLNVATVQYTRSSIVGGALPMQSSIDEARIYLSEAQKRVSSLSNLPINDQVKDKELRELTRLVYSRIPKVKARNAAESEWILSTQNILGWQQDLDAFEQALYSNVVDDEPQSDPFGGLAIDMEWIDPKSDLGRFVEAWWPNATLNRHGYLGRMKIKNAWRIDRHEDKGKIEAYQKSILPECKGCRERPIKQPSERSDLFLMGYDKKQVKEYKDSNTALLFHGTRSVNVSGIMRTSFKLPRELVGVSITGAMFGGGIYFADDWKKSAGYTSLRNSYYSSGSGSVRNRGAFMFACDTVLGEAEIAPGPRGYTGAPKGKHCIFGKAGRSGVQNNEWITFKKESTRIRYLVEFDA